MDLILSRDCTLTVQEYNVIREIDDRYLPNKKEFPPTNPNKIKFNYIHFKIIKGNPVWAVRFVRAYVYFYGEYRDNKEDAIEDVPIILKIASNFSKQKLRELRIKKWGPLDKLNKFTTIRILLGETVWNNLIHPNRIKI